MKIHGHVLDDLQPVETSVPGSVLLNQSDYSICISLQVVTIILQTHCFSHWLIVALGLGLCAQFQS